MKKPKKTLKELSRIAALLSKQTGRSAKLLARRKTGDAENPVTSGYYDRIATQHAIALADLSEIGHLNETLTRHVVEAEAEKAAKKAAKSSKSAPAKAAPAKPSARTTKTGPKIGPKTGPKTGPKPARKAATPKAAAANPTAAKPAPKRPARRAPVKAAEG